ncbi:hypothetical protein T261_5593 [Streptomyces lydicus]|nr:hypothetical protein T261_5593 [Streptomyces lydicus]
MMGAPAMPSQAGPTPTNTAPPRGTTPPSRNGSPTPNNRPDATPQQQPRPDRPAYNPRPDASRPAPSRPGAATPRTPQQRPQPNRPDPRQQPHQRPTGDTPAAATPQSPTSTPQNTPTHPASAPTRTEQPPTNTPTNTPNAPENSAHPDTPATPHHPDATNEPNHPKQSDQPDHATPDTTPDATPHSNDPDHTNDPTPASETRNRERPGGLEGPTDEHQNNVESTVPRDENGEPQRHPDPNDGNWLNSINDPGPDAPGRNNNCVDTALATTDTYSGNPTAAANRTPDTNSDGTPSDRGEKNGRDRIENTLGARFNDYGNGPDAFNRLENTLRNAGHGSQAVIITQDPNGRAHAWNVVNHNGNITYVDAQTGQRSNKPLHDGTNGVHAIPLNTDRRPINDHARAGDSNREAPRNPAGNNPQPPKDPAGASRLPSQNPDWTPSKELPDRDLGPREKAGEKHPIYDRNVPDVGEGSEYRNLPMDDMQYALRERNPVHQVDAAPIHAVMRGWAESENGEPSPLAQVLAATARSNPNRQPLTQRQLSEILTNPKFSELNQGQRGIVVATLARMSISYHEAHAATPENSEKAPGAALRERTGWDKEYRQGEEIDKAIKNVFSEVDAARANERNKQNGIKTNHKAPGYAAMLADSGDHRPDFSGKNYAVLEVKRPDGEIEYLIDSSIPAGTHGFTPGHSESRLLAELERRSGENLTPIGLYTEREPCGLGEGHANCSSKLIKALTEDVPIYYSTSYRTDQDGVDLREPTKKEYQKKFEDLANSDLSDKEKERQARKLRTARENKLKALRTDLEKDVVTEFKRYLLGVGMVWTDVLGDQLRTENEQ